VLENPSGGGSSDNFFEYIELYGPPGFDLTGYAIALVKGGADDGDDVPERPAEIDEAFTLDGLAIGANGFLVLYNNDIGFSEIGAFLNGPFGPGANAAGWSDTSLGIPTSGGENPGRLSNDDSSTYLLVRARPFHEVQGGASLYDGSPTYVPASRYAFRKDVNPDQNFDGKLDFAQQGFLAVDPLQIVDEIAWSDNGGKEYVRSSEQEISETPGFNPDGLARLAYYAENPMLGHRINGEGMIVPTRTADESWIYGENTGQTVVLDGADTEELILPFDPAESGAPTDQDGPTYNAAGELDPMGSFLLDDIDVAGFRWTPGDFNDSPAIAQFRFTPGDVDFDGVANVQDFALARSWSLTGATLDDRETRINDNDTPGDPGDDFMFDAYVFEGRLLNGYVAAAQLDTMDDGMGGNAETLTSFDVTALRVLIGAGVAPDQNNDGVISAADLAALIGAWGSDDPLTDLDADGVVGASDLALLIGAWGPLD
jgi:hypothetical protein